jgi:ectoine hydroxylase-related dioxygenase (phytanoyl-CoA dioxygenase family)
VLNLEHAILKPALCGAPTPWHQDEAYRKEPDFLYRQVSFWIPLDDAVVESGCLHFIPGRIAVKSCRIARTGTIPARTALECVDVVGVEKACPVPGKRATVLPTSGRTLHYAGPNRSPRPRFAYILEFEAPPTSYGRGAAVRVARRP